MSVWINRWMGAEIYFVHIGHGALFWVVIAIVALNVPWWAMLLGSPIIVGSIWGWFAEARIVLPVADRLLRGVSGVSEEGMMTTATTAPRGDGAARRDAGRTEDGEEMRGNRWRI